MLVELQIALKMNKFLRKYVVKIILFTFNLLALCSPLDRQPLSAFDSIDTFFCIKEKASPHNKSSFIMPRSRNGRRSGTCFTPEIVGISQSSIDEFRRCPMWIVERINRLPYHINYANRARKTGGQQGI